jgi:hypothetical protein
MAMASVDPSVLELTGTGALDVDVDEDSRARSRRRVVCDWTSILDVWVAIA